MILLSLNKAWVVDTAERTLATFAAAFFGLWLAPVLAAVGNGGDVPTAIHGVLLTSVAVKAALASVPAALTVVKAAFAALRKNSTSPASFAPAVQPQQALEGAPPDAGYSLVELLVAAVLLVLFVWLVVSLVGR